VEQPELVRRIVETLESLSAPYMIVGSLASAVYGEPRLTQDVDFVVALPLSDVGSLCAAFPSPEFPGVEWSRGDRRCGPNCLLRDSLAIAE
jgi:hypothetical protein